MHFCQKSIVKALQVAQHVENRSMGGGYNNACGRYRYRVAATDRYRYRYSACGLDQSDRLWHTECDRKKHRYGIIKPSAPLRVTEA